MIWLRYELQAVSRVSAGRGPQVVNHRPAHDVIPGSAVRGALATAWARDHGMSWTGPTLEFQWLFEGQHVFGQAGPTSISGKEWQPVGASLRRCKYPDDGCTHPTEGQDVAMVRLRRQDVAAQCPCGGTFEYGKPTPDARIVTTTRTALTADGIPQTGLLFTRASLEKATTMSGRLGLHDGPGSSTTDVDDAQKWLCQERRLRLGGQRSVLGDVRWSASVDVQPRDDTEAGDYVLRVISPLILVDDFGAPTLDPGPTLRALCQQAVEIDGRWVRPVKVAGWHAASALPKPADWAVGPGSTFVVRGLPAGAGGLLDGGLGLRRAEGFGQVQLLQDTARPDLDKDDPVAMRINDIRVERVCTFIDAQEPAPRKALRKQLSHALDGVVSAPPESRAALVEQKMHALTTSGRWALVDASHRQDVAEMLGGVDIVDLRALLTYWSAQGGDQR